MGRWGGRDSPYSGARDILPPKDFGASYSKQKERKVEEQNRFERQQDLLKEFASPSTSHERKMEIMGKNEKLIRREFPSYFK